MVMEEYRMCAESEPWGAVARPSWLRLLRRTLIVSWAQAIGQVMRRTCAARTPGIFSRYGITCAGQHHHGDRGRRELLEAKRLAEKYFAAMPAPLPPLLHTVELPQTGPKRTEIESPSQPLLLVGHKTPDQYSKDDPVFDIVSGVLSSGRTGLLYKEMVRDKQIALAVEAEDTFPGGKYPNLFLFFLAPAMGHTTADNEKAFYDLLERFQSQKVDAVTLARVKTKTRADLIRRLDSNSGLASLLTANYAAYGDWTKLFTSLDDLDKVTSDDVQRVARQYFTPENRTVAYLIVPKRQAGGAQ